MTLQPDSSYSAQLNAIGSCSTSCTTFLRWQTTVGGTWTNGPTLSLGKTTNASFNQVATGLQTRQIYGYQACGKEAVTSTITCVGPDGTPNTTQQFNTGPPARVARSTWTKIITPVAPSGRLATMAFDPATRQTVLFGGSAGGLAFADTWTWDGSAWTLWHPAHQPPARTLPQMAYDPATGQLLMFGGSQPGGAGLAGTWVWTGSDWAQLQPATSPPNRSSGVMAYDPVAHQIVLFGGFQDTGGGAGNLENDTWTWDGNTWTQQHPATSPPPTSNGAMAF